MLTYALHKLKRMYSNTIYTNDLKQGENRGYVYLIITKLKLKGEQLETLY